MTTVERMPMIPNAGFGGPHELAQSAIDRLQSAAHELVLDGESYRQRQRPGITTALDQPPTAPRSSRRRR